jgi:hypothetical protein
MSKLRLYLYKINDEKYLCNVHLPNTELFETESKKSYLEAGRKMLTKLNGLSVNDPLYLTLLHTTDIKLIKNPNLTKVKNSLEKYIQDNKLNIKLEVAA